MNYYGRYGLEFNPFIKNAKEILVETTEYKEVTGRLNYLAENKGFGLLIGGPGKGKTTTIRHWVSTLSTSLYKPIYISLSTSTVAEFYRQLAIALGIIPAFRKSENFKLIQDAINRLSIEKKITPIIILDEANYIRNGILNDLKMLFNFEMDSKDRAVVLLVGLPQIRNTLSLNAHEPLRQRIVMNYEMDGMNKTEMKKYISKKLEGAGCVSAIYEDNAIEAIVNASSGIPRVTNNLCDKSLMIGNQLNMETITSEIIMKAVNESAIF
ncbi:type II secretory pathway predicted ATPase ExeA [Breznakia blatticola]|uniref:Type II secretory pathway predicted ATPase ExeA n=1 Tax=Breznakia blatticola TaxID=1754012 RepID=A0A4R7Z845_9FIRM|nr:AAA family ATPase [Breznakia blatticola]TDW07923.1 type II secretory pathway predicted ATPase ExeA [Breznakia blatticola]